jgi:hypothetical protein
MLDKIVAQQLLALSMCFVHASLADSKSVMFVPFLYSNKKKILEATNEIRDST